MMYIIEDLNANGNGVYIIVLRAPLPLDSDYGIP